MDSEENLEILVQIRLTHMANQYERLLSEGHIADAELVRDEGLRLAEAYDSEDPFFVIGIDELLK